MVKQELPSIDAFVEKSKEVAKEFEELKKERGRGLHENYDSEFEIGSDGKSFHLEYNKNNDRYIAKYYIRPEEESSDDTDYWTDLVEIMSPTKDDDTHTYYFLADRTNYRHSTGMVSVTGNGSFQLNVSLLIGKEPIIENIEDFRSMEATGTPPEESAEMLTTLMKLCRHYMENATTFDVLEKEEGGKDE